MIAEAGVNHNGDLELARRLVEAAARAGADAVKFQSFSAARLASGDAPKPRYQRQRTGDAGSQRSLLERLELDPPAHAQLRAAAERHGIEFMSSPFDAASADLLETLGVRRYKLASGEITNHPLLRHVAAKGRPVLLSTGMSTLAEVERAVATLREAGVADLTLLHCTSRYPAEADECNLRAMQTMREAIGLPVGYSDHTLGIEIACAAVALGAVAVEKHFTLDRGLPGPDHAASLEVDELAALVRAIRNVERALGDGVKQPVAGELETRRLVRRGLVAARDLAAGQCLRSEDVLVQRPARGLPPSALDAVIGCRLRSAVGCGEPLRREHLAGD